MSTAQAPSNRDAEHASRTITITPTPPEAGPSNSDPSQPGSAGVLRLRGGPVKQKVLWSKDTVDNEGMGKKKSKICCIYHKPRAYDESSSESSTSDDEPRSAASSRHDSASRGPHGDEAEVEESSESEGGGGDGKARPMKARRHRHHHHDHPHQYGHPHHHEHPPKANKYDLQDKGSKGKAPS